MAEFMAEFMAEYMAEFMAEFMAKLEINYDHYGKGNLIVYYNSLL
jgi:hypothetical protein